MTVESFIPVLWSAKFAEILDKVHRYANCANRDWEGEIKGKGSSVRIQTIGDLTVSDYTRNQNITAAETLNLADQALVIDQAKLVHFFLDSVDKAQALDGGSLMSKAMERSAYAIKDVVDIYVATLFNTAVDGTANDVTNGTPLTVGTGASEIDAYGLLVELGVKLDNANVPKEGRKAVVPPFFEGMLRLDPNFVGFGTSPNMASLKGEPIGRAAGFEVLTSNNCPAGASSSKVALAVWDGASTFAEQLTEMQAYKPELRFGDAVKSLHVYGGKVTHPAGIAAAEVLQGAFR
ncbi:MAG: P22 coat protein - protein 5 domain protein [Dehalococcoidia bacterium]